VGAAAGSPAVVVPAGSGYLTEVADEYHPKQCNDSQQIWLYHASMKDPSSVTSALSALNGRALVDDTVSELKIQVGLSMHTHPC
jgi:hypothetical protein